MKKKYRLKKSAISILVIFIFLITLVIFMSLAKSKSYSVEYNINEYDISENYDKDKEIYYFEITKDKLVYSTVYKSKYLKEKKIIKDIKEYSEEEYKCIVPGSSVIKSYPLCNYKNNIIDYHLVPESLQKKLSDYYKKPPTIEKNIGHYELFNKENELLIWSYKGFNYIKDGKEEFIKLFKEDIYEIPLATKINNYLFVPDYEQKYIFNKVYIINLDNLKIKTWKLKYDISFDSYIAGTNEISIYLIDKKSKIEYELVPEKQKMRILAKGNKQGIIYNKGTIQKETMKKLATKNYKFIYDYTYNYYLEKQNLYLSYLDSNIKTRITNQEVKEIVSIQDDNVFYLVEDTLYRYNLKYGEVKIIKYPEWNINYKNLIFINN